jgi:SAM-dependent methyltransferase
MYFEERSEGFDARFGTDTSSPVLGRNPNAASHFYVPTTGSVIYEILGKLPLKPNRFSFVDMGSGKGRALLVASEFPFAKIVGVELSAHLHGIAEENIERYQPDSQACKNFTLHCMNAADYAFGSEPVVLFLFDPFGEEILRRVLANLEASFKAAPREVFVVYVFPQFEALLRGSSYLNRISEGGPRWRPWSSYVIYGTSRQSSPHMPTPAAVIPERRSLIRDRTH